MVFILILSFNLILGQIYKSQKFTDTNDMFMIIPITLVAVFAYNSALYLGVRSMAYFRISLDILGDGGIWWDTLGDLLRLRISLVNIS